MTRVSISPARDLRTGRAIWQRQRVRTVAHGPLTRDTSADVVVVGAGISGALVSESLSDAGFDVLVLDRRGPIEGSTVASTALLQYDIDTPLIHLARRVGWNDAVRIWRRSRLVVDALRERVRYLGIEADCANRDSLYLDGDVLNPRALRHEAEARQRAGFEVQFLTPSEVARRCNIHRRSAILKFDHWEADPRRLAAGFLRAAAARGARVAAPADVVHVEPGKRGTRVTTAAGPVVTTRFVVFATGYEVPTRVPQQGHAIASTWVIATRPQPRALWPGRSFVCEASDPYLYIRTSDGRVICGGEDESFSSVSARDALLPLKTRTLERRLHRLLPALDARADYAWCGSFGASVNGTPSIGAVPRMPRCSGSAATASRSRPWRRRSFAPMCSGSAIPTATCSPYDISRLDSAALFLALHLRVFVLRGGHPLGFERLCPQVQRHEDAPGREEQRSGAGDRRRVGEVFRRLVRELEDRDQRLDREGHHDDHEESRQEPPGPRRTADVRTAEHLLLEHGLAELECRHGNREVAYTAEHRVEAAGQR